MESVSRPKFAPITRQYSPGFVHGNYSNTAVVEGARRIMAGQVVRFVIANHPLPELSDAPGKVHECIILGPGEIDGEPRIRYVGEGCDPMGAGSHSVPIFDPTDWNDVAGTLGYILGRQTAKAGPAAVLYLDGHAEGGAA